MPLQELIYFLISNLTSSIDFEWLRFNPSQSLTAAAFCKQRDKLDPQALVEINRLLVQQVPDRRWKGLRLLALDGTTLNLPMHSSTAEAFPVSKKRQRPQARLSQLYDIANQLTLDVQIQPLSVGEREMAATQLADCKPGDLLIADRGYAGRAFYQRCLDAGIDFCIRVPASHSLVVYDFFCSGLPQQESSAMALSKAVRFVRVPLECGEDEVLITSLTNTDEFPTECFKALYFKRWGVEEDYKKLKSRLQIEQFSGKKLRAVLQDILATVLHKNWAALCVQAAQDEIDARPSNCKHPKQVNFTQACRLLKSVWCSRFAWDWDALILQMLRYCNSRRSERSFTRLHKKKQPPAMAYK